MRWTHEGGPAQCGEALPVEEAWRQGAHIGCDHVGLDQGVPQDRADGPVVQRMVGDKDQRPRDRDADQGGDGRDPAGIYFGTNSGSVFGSIDEGENWQEIARHLPTILAVEVLDRR